MLYRSLTITSFLLATGLLWSMPPGLARSAISQASQSAPAPSAEPPLLPNTPTLESSPTNVIVPIAPGRTSEQPNGAPSQTTVPSRPVNNTAPATPAVNNSGTPPAPSAPGFPQPSDLPSPPAALPTPPIATDPPSPQPLAQPSPASTPASTSPKPEESPATSAPTATPAATDTATPTEIPPGSNILLPKPPGLQEQPGNIVDFGTEPSPPEVAKPLRLEIQLSKRQVTLYEGEGVVKRYPIAVGRPGWETPKGKFRVEQMFKNPIWVSPLQKGVTIPGGDPDNPLGRHWIGFWTDGKNWIGFHGTPNPRSVGTAASHGCIRMYNKDIEDLFHRVSLGVEVTVID